MSGTKEKLNFAIQLVQQAYNAKKVNDYAEAKKYFTEAIETMLAVASSAGVPAETKKYLQGEMKTYLAEVEELNIMIQLEGLKVADTDLAPKVDDEIRLLIIEGDKLSAEADNYYAQDAMQEAVNSYAEASAKLLKARELEKVADKKSLIADNIESILARAEVAKRQLKGESHKVVKIGPASLTSTEIKVLQESSSINGHLFLPWMDEDAKESYRTPQPFTDPDGFIPLAGSQKPHFKRWARASEIYAVPTVGRNVNANHLKQSLIGDCSFIGSLALTLHHEFRFKKRLVRNLIYPQDHNGNSIYNPCGQYAVKLFLNGIWRKVVIDDFFPVDSGSQFLCSYVTETNDIWLSLLEKAYMKVNGGYDFPGSNSGVDLMALTGWFPERISFQKTDTTKIWDRMVSGTKSGDCLITVSTDGDISEDVEESMGLVKGHAYAILEVLEVAGQKLLMVKNPWAHKRWKGKFSFDDKNSWTPELKKLLHFEEFNLKDNGMFWIDFDSLCIYFPNMHINWNPALLPYRYVGHDIWPVEQGPKTDTTTIGYNPQIRMKLESGGKPAIVWVLLSKHFSQHYTQEENFLTLHVMNSVDGSRLYYNEGSKQRSVYTNSLHCLVTLEIEPTEPQEYIFVVSQIEKTCDIRFSVQIMATCRFDASPLPLTIGNPTRTSSQWRGETAAGPTNVKKYFNNPQFSFEAIDNKSVPRDSIPVLFRLETDSSIPVNLHIFTGSDSSEFRLKSFHGRIADTGSYRYGFACTKVSLQPNQKYVLIPSTYEEGTPASFNLTAECALPTKLTSL